MNWRLLSFLAGIGIFALVSSLTGARADEQGVVATKLILIDDSANGGSRSLSLKLAGPGIHKGADGSRELLSGLVEIFYVNGTTRGTLSMPAPWAKNARGQAKFVNREAPAGGSAVQSASFSTGKKAKVVAVDLGGLDLSLPPDDLGVLVVVTLQNDNDSAGTIHKMCAKFSVDEGSTIQHANRNGKRSLLMTNGIEAPCNPPCGEQTFTFSVASHRLGIFSPLHVWPEGTVTECNADGCCVQVRLPEGYVDGDIPGFGPGQFLLPLDPSGFFIYTFSGFSNCQAEACTNACNDGYEEGPCWGNRPFCLAPIFTTATYTVQCEN